MKRIVVALAMVMAVTVAEGQTNWKGIDKLIEEGSYKSAYAAAEKTLKTTKDGTELLTAAWYMTRAAAEYQEDFYDSAVVRYHAILPRLDAVDRAVCYAFLGVKDSALMDEEVLKHTASERLKRFCREEDFGKELEGINITPTAYDVVVNALMEHDSRNQALLQKLIDFHREDDDFIRITLDLKMLDMQGYNPRSIRYVERLQGYINKYRGSSCPLVAQLYHRMAEHLSNNGSKAEALRYCDTAIALYPKSYGSGNCANLRSIICREYIGFTWSSEGTAYPDRPSLHVLSYNNLSRIHFAVFPCKDEDIEKTIKRHPKAVHQWSLDVKDDGSHIGRDVIFSVPALPMGHWLLMASTDAKFDEEDAYMTLQCRDFAICNTDNGEFLIADAVSGAPISGQKVILLMNYSSEKNDTVTTQSDGRFRIPKNRYVESLRIERGGVSFEHSVWSSAWKNSTDRKMNTNAKIVLDRPIYRPGDTVHCAALFYKSDGVDGSVCPNRGVTMKFCDPNDKDANRLSLFADDHGVVSATFVVPKDALVGPWSVRISSGDYSTIYYFRVEEYKQPKFMVSLEQPKVAPAFGQTYRLHGLAKAYSGANISGAKVKYTVSRNCNMFWKNGLSTDTIFSDSTVTALDGSFEIPFTPMPDTVIDASYRPVYRYTVRVDVTDLNGETHNASYFVCVGYVNKAVSLADNKERTNELPEINYSFTDLNGNPLEGDVAIKIEHLQLPEPLRLVPTVMINNPRADMALGRDEYHRLFPDFAYSSDENSPRKWQADWSHQVNHHADGSKTSYSVDLTSQKLRSGEYRVVATAGEVSDTIYITLVLPQERKFPVADLLWMDAPQEMEVGGTCTVRYASAFDGTRVFYILEGPDGQEITSQWLTADRRIRTLTIPVDSSLLGSFKVQFVAIRDGVTRIDDRTVTVPFTHKKLVVDIATFRDKLQPGEQEEWTIKVTELLSDQVTESPRNPVTQKPSHSATLLMTMYDDALNSYSTRPSWSFNPWRYGNHGLATWRKIQSQTNPYYQQIDYQHYEPAEYYRLVLSEGLFRGYSKYGLVSIGMDEEVFSAKSTARGESGRVTMQGGVRKRTGVNVNNELVVNAAVMETEEEAVLQSAPAAAAADDAEPAEVTLRTNLSTLAFFVADLHTDSTGSATYRFRVPELLTRWNVYGLAFTDDLKIGTLDRTLVTQKPLMVQPNIPRFLRHGDSLEMMAKVVNLTDTARLVCVSFSRYNAADGFQLDSTVQWVTVDAKGSTQVTFMISMLRDNLQVCTYQITARTAREHPGLPVLSDGERGQIPVVSSRQAVTVSQSLYINGKGQKDYTFHLSTSSSTAESILLSAEVVGNPVWMAIKTMPYLKNLENPSTLYLANQYFVNRRGWQLSSMLPSHMFDSAFAPSPLRLNEDVKQTLLQSTPWALDADSEEEQMRNLATYFDTDRLEKEFQTLKKELNDRQNADGGLSWMPAGKSSLWVTQQVLKRLAEVSDGLEPTDLQKKALKYIDSEQQRHYEKYIKPYLKKKQEWNPTDIDYLYTRSFYGKGKTEAYKFFYSNALKSYRQYGNLYTQAQLALIFHRHGDRKAALDLLRRLKEKALESDEMGLYWRDNKSGWCWYERPIETQALLIEAFAEITPKDTLAVARMQQWLLKQKQTTHWRNDQATTRAISALMLKGSIGKNAKKENDGTQLIVFGDSVKATPFGTLEGYCSQRWTGAGLDTLITRQSSLITLKKSTPGIAWASVCYQYADDMDKIPASEMGITLKRSYLHDGPMKVGDRVRVRIEISCDRAMDYLELIDGRASCMEPLSTRSGWQWSSGLSYYVTVNNTDTRLYIEHIDKGKYVAEYEVYVTNPGSFLAGPVTMQCMYAPEFRATAPATRLTVEK